MKRLLAACLALALGACTSTGEEKVVEAATSPLADLNLVRAKIPPVLLEAKGAPYAPPSDASCAAIATHVRALDEALGPDLDAPPDPSDPGLMERGTALASEQALNAIRSASEGLLPYRGWVRKLTGAERYSKQVAAAIAAGGVRRAYLKGLGGARGCQAPAAPRIAPAS